MFKGKPYKAKYCNICGKIDCLIFGESEKIEKDGRIFYRNLSYEEICNKYKNLEHIEIDDIWNKYVPISKGE